MLTIDKARVWGIDDQTGFLEAGKQTDLALFNGDPFEYTTTAEQVVIGK